MRLQGVLSLLLTISLVGGVLVGCGDDDPAPQTTANNGTDNNGTNNGTNNDDNNGTNNDDNNGTNNDGTNNGTPDFTGEFPNGIYQVGVLVTPLGGLVLPLQFDVASAGDTTGGTFTSVSLRAIGRGESLSEVLSTVTDVAVDANGEFRIDFPATILPGAYTITGSDVEVQVSFIGRLKERGLFCGTVEGRVITLDTDLAGSTFGSIEWDQRGSEAPTSCASDGGGEIARIETCPALTAGMNTGFMSAETARTFDVVLPSDYDSAHSYPLVFVYHGLGGTTTEILDTGIAALAERDDFIIVAPQALDNGDTTVHDVFGTPRVNKDLVFFDDLLKCAGEQWNIDPDRVHVTGMSNGGLMTGYLLNNRAEVIASAAPFSGGLLADYTNPPSKMPVVVSWGGTSDVAFDQDFNLLAGDMIDALKANDQFVVGCNHDTGHSIEAAFWEYGVLFLLDHPRGLASEPYATALPNGFPDYCAIR